MPLEHVDQKHLERGNTDITGCRNLCAWQWRTETGGIQRGNFAVRGMQQLVLVHHDPVGTTQVAHLERLHGRAGDLAHGDLLETLLEQRVAVAGKCLGVNAHGQCAESAAGRQQTDTGFDQAHVGLQVGNYATGVHGKLQSTTQRQATNRSDTGHGCMT